MIGLLNSSVVAAQLLYRRRLLDIHLARSFARWHYLYTMYDSSHDEISVMARIACMVVVVSSIMANAAYSLTLPEYGVSR